MNTGEEKSLLLDQVPTLLRELRARRLALAAAFAGIAIVVAVVGLLWPSKYESAATVQVIERNIIQPLMEGRAVPTGVSDRAAIAREVIFGRRILNEIMAAGGWLKKNPSPREQELIAEEIKRRTTISSPGQNLIRIAYSDSDPERAYHVAQKFAELFISESLAAKERESRNAFQFIAGQVDEYHRKLTDAENRLKAFREKNADARPGSDADVAAHISALRSRIEDAQTQIAEIDMREASLGRQLSGETELSGVVTREGQYREQIAELQSRLDTLRLSYTDEYPDVIALRHQIDDLQNQLARVQAVRAQAQADGQPVAPNVVFNPIYQQMRGDLTKARSDRAALVARIADTRKLLAEETERGKRVAASEATLAELTRDYEVNRDIYQDLLKRREGARLSMQMDEEHQGLTFRIQEAAALPLLPSGLRFAHFLAIGLILGALLPVGLLIGVVRFDPRVRDAQLLTRDYGLPVLVTVPAFAGAAARERDMRLNLRVAALIALVVVAYAALTWLRVMRWV